VKGESPPQPQEPGGLRPTAKGIALPPRPPGMPAMVLEGSYGAQRTELSWEKQEDTSAEARSAPGAVGVRSAPDAVAKEEAELKSEEEFEPLPPAEEPVSEEDIRRFRGVSVCPSGGDDAYDTAMWLRQHAHEEKASEYQVQRVRELLNRLFVKYTPDFIENVDLLLDKYRGQEIALHIAVCERYQVRPVFLHARPPPQDPSRRLLEVRGEPEVRRKGRWERFFEDEAPLLPRLVVELQDPEDLVRDALRQYGGGLGSRVARWARCLRGGPEVPGPPGLGVRGDEAPGGGPSADVLGAGLGGQLRARSRTSGRTRQPQSRKPSGMRSGTPSATRLRWPTLACRMTPSSSGLGFTSAAGPGRGAAETGTRSNLSRRVSRPTRLLGPAGRQRQSHL
jgi:hypothetical protein